MVGDLSLLAVASASPVVLAPSKELHAVLPFQGKRPQDASKSASVQLCAPQHLDGAFQGQPPVPVMQAPAYQAFAVPDMATLIDVQDSHPDSVQLCLGIAEQCARQEKMLKFLMSGSDVKEIDVSLLAELTGNQTLQINLGSQPHIPDDKLSIYEFGLDEPQQYLLENQIVIPDPLVDFVRSRGSALTIDQNGQVLFTGSGDEMRDLISIALEFNMSRQEASGCKTAFLVPYFDRKRLALAKVSSSKVASTTVDDSKSTANVKTKYASKKKQKGKNKEREYQKNYFHASEAFLSILLDKDKSSSSILSLKKACPEVSELLTQCSIGIAGTGLAILLSVVCKMAAGGRTPLAATRLLNTGVGFGLFWLSWAVNGLRDTIISIFRNPGDMNLKEDVAVKIQKNMNDILFRAVTLVAITALKFA